LTNTRNSLLGRTADITIDRQQGSRNVGHKHVRYCVKAGYFTAQQELPREKRQMIYIMGAEDITESFSGMILGTIKRPETGQLLLVAAPEGKLFCEPQIRECLGFYERQHHSDFQFYMSIACGMILIKDYGDVIRFLLAQDRKTGKISFIKDGIRYGETEKNAAVRTVSENTGISPDVRNDFRTEYVVGTPDNRKQKTIIYLGQYKEKKLRIPEDCGFRTVNLEFEKAVKSLDDPQERILLMEAKDYYESKRKSRNNLQETQ